MAITFAVGRVEAGAFVVIDYPEESRAAVRSLLKASGSLERTACPIRLLPVSRHPLEWWSDELIAAGTSELCDGQEVAVGPLDAGQTCALVRDAVARLSGHFGRAEPVAVPDEAAAAAWHGRDPARHGLPLFAAAAAVHAVLDRAPTFELAGAEIVRALVRREQRRLDRGETSEQATFRLAPLAAAICRALLNVATLGEEERATLLNNLSNFLGEAGDDRAALDVIREAVEIRRRLTGALPARFARDLAQSLYNLADCLERTGDPAGAEAAKREADGIMGRRG
ncbi:tetratricopeptide repeat protein [Skermanella mucosa]|uniref:tetratricopeptide repeat protein n=1 Tax=Skermanella mucosa TaxID=1789672 RepID=UPI00192B1D9A|nr:tetratricopeptide repeat protein [Skermanella mucosa]UEM21946.1 tetratricopeptide repeat protein [Skermanella mucosa]